MDKSRFAWAQVAIVLLLGAAVFLPNLGQEISLKKNEGRHAEIARNMLQTGQYIVPYTCGKPYIDKPPFFNWTVAALSLGTGRADIVTARLASALSAIAAALAVYVLGVRWFSPRAGVLAAIMWITCWMTIEWGRFARMDMMMAALALCGVLLADIAAATAKRRERIAVWLLAWFAVGLAGISKNLAVLLFFAPAVAAIWRARQGRWLMPLGLAAAGLAVSLLPYAAWAAAAEITRPGHLAAMWGYQAGQGVVEHPGGFTLYMVALPAQTLPWVAFIGGAAYWSYRRLRHAGFDRAFIPAFVCTACLVVMTIVPTKRPHYLLPMLPFWLLWLAGFVDAGLSLRSAGASRLEDGPDRAPKWAFEIPLAGALVGLIAVLAWLIIFWTGDAHAHKTAGALIIAVIAGIATAGLVFTIRRRFEPAVWTLALALSAMAVAGYPVFLPGFNEPAPEYAAAHEIAGLIPRGDPVADYDVRDPLICLDLDRNVTFVDDLEGVGEFVSGPGPRFVLVKPKYAASIAALSGGRIAVLGVWNLPDLKCAVLQTVAAGPAEWPPPPGQ